MCQNFGVLLLVKLRLVMIDSDGFRANVGIILANTEGQVLWTKRVGQDSWQFPQGGIDKGETPLDAMYRELYEEVGLCPHHVEMLGVTHDWLRYRLPRRYVGLGKSKTGVCFAWMKKTPILFALIPQPLNLMNGFG